MKATVWTAAVMLGISIAVVIAAVPRFGVMHQEEAIKKGAGVTAVKLLSDYFAGLKGTEGDTEVYLLDSGQPGGTVVILGGTHPNEPSGFITAVMLIENARPAKGRFIVIRGRTPAGSRTTTIPKEARSTSACRHRPASAGFDSGRVPPTPSTSGRTPISMSPLGTEAFGQRDAQPQPCLPGACRRQPDRAGRLRNRATHSNGEGGYRHRPARGLARIPGDQRHGGSRRAMEVAATAVIGLQLDGIEIGLEPSPKTLRGLSHREWGDATETLAILIESANPAQGRLRGATSAELVVSGEDQMYARAAKLGRLFVPFEGKGIPLSVRVARHMATSRNSFGPSRKSPPTGRSN